MASDAREDRERIRRRTVDRLVHSICCGLGEIKEHIAAVRYPDRTDAVGKIGGAVRDLVHELRDTRGGESQ